MTNLVFCNSATTEGAGLYYDVLGTFDRRELYLQHEERGTHMDDHHFLLLWFL